MGATVLNQTEGSGNQGLGGAVAVGLFRKKSDATNTKAETKAPPASLSFRPSAKQRKFVDDLKTDLDMDYSEVLRQAVDLLRRLNDELDIDELEAFAKREGIDTEKVPNPEKGESSWEVEALLKVMLAGWKTIRPHGGHPPRSRRSSEHP